MYRSLALSAVLAVMCLGACAREHSQPASAASEPAATQAGASGAASPAPAAPATSSSAASATTAQSSSAAADEVPGTSSLEQLAAMPPAQQLPDGRWKAGVNYDAIVPAQPTSAAPGKVEVLEVFWLGCPHCYALEPYIRKWLEQKPSYIQFVRVPVMWGPPHRLHAQLFYTLEALGRDDLVEKAFDTIHRDNNPLLGETEQDSFDKQLAWAQANGLDANAFRTAYNSFGVHASLEHAQEITERYHVEGVPLIIVAGKFSTDVGKAGGSCPGDESCEQAQLMQLIDDLAAFEHRRPHRG
jgi:protein dithiol oxidoreductase (disulfide-forming)